MSTKTNPWTKILHSSVGTSDFMMIFLIALLLTGCWSSLGATVTIEPCPPGWTEFDDSCYRYFPLPKTWTEAQEFCRSVGSNGYSTGINYQTSDLTSIHSQAENDFLFSYWGGCRDSESPDVTNLWIGLIDPDRNRNWKWVDGSVVNYLNWSPAEPNNFNNEEYWVQMRITQEWNDQSVSEQFTFICKMPRHCGCQNN